MPMHVGDNHDRGGNDTQVRFFDRGTNMHRLWDSDMIERVSKDEDFWLNVLDALDLHGNRQAAVKAIAGAVDALIVIGSPNSSNSSRLVEVARAYGCARSVLVPRASEIDWSWLDGVRRLGLTAGASAPELLVEEVVAEARRRYDVTLEERAAARESVTFKLPGALSRASRVPA